MAYLVAAKQFGRPILDDGVTPNPIWNELVQAATRGLYVRNFPTYLKLEGIIDYEELTISKVYALATLGVETHEYPAWVKLPLENLTDNVPSFLPGAYVLDEQGEETETLKTWNQWKGESAPQTETHAIIGLVHGGTDVLGSVIKQLIDGSFVVLSQPAAQAEVATISVE